jgi:cell division protein FtsI (penicillin-binding protein 3)
MPNDPAATSCLRVRAAVLVFVFVSILFVGLGARLYHINTDLAEDLTAIAIRQQQSGTAIPARRGMILDVRGRVIASSESSPDVFVDAKLVKDIDALAAKLSSRVNEPAAAIAEKIRARPSSRFIIVAKEIDDVTEDAVLTMGEVAVGLSHRSVRNYPLHESMAHVLGWVGRDGEGMEGLELRYDKHLSGTPGWRGTVRDARRRAIGRSTRGPVAPEDGGHIVLTIDAEIQRVTEDALARAVLDKRAESGVAIVMSARTGEIRAMACYPTFDANEAPSVPAALRRNRTVTDPTEPGSTFKPIIMSSALDGGFVSRTEKIDCQMGTLRLGRRVVKDTRPHGMMNVKGIIAKSSNIGMTKIGLRMGNDVLHETVRRFGFGAITGVGFPGEARGLVRPLRKWSRSSTPSVSYGYEIAVTPLQLATAYVALMNDGVLIRPRLVRAILNASGDVVEEFVDPEPLRRVASSEVSRFVTRELMRAVVEEGGGHRARSEQYTVMGKTGTAKLLYKDKPVYEPGAYLGTFVGAAPVESPELVVLVMVRRPASGLAYYGGAVSAPAVKDILDRSLAYMGVPPDRAKSARLATYRP